MQGRPALQEWQQQFQSWNKSYWDVWGLFAEWNGELDENTRITAGGRFNFITKKDVVMDGLADISGTLNGYNSTAALAAGQGTLGVGFPVLPEYEEDFNEFTGRVVVDRKLSINYDSTCKFVEVFFILREYWESNSKSSLASS